ncbi:MAG TPA: CopD family protein [Candidatus Udaeobacter sp.]|jgi:putative copper resistance protein D|nr:CopD family protein [Candidatus Udaeobacter sp.]
MLILLLIIARTAHIGATVLLGGTFTFELITLGPARQAGSDDFLEVERRLLRLARWSLVAALLSSLLWFWLEVANMSGLPAMRASTTAWQMVLFETKFGHVWQLRLGLIVLAFALVALRVAQFQARHALIMAMFLTSIVLLVSLAWISHAAAARVQPLGLLGDALHLCAASVWIGGLLPLAIFLTHTRESLLLGEQDLRVLRRFSTLSLSCVGVLILSGISNSWLLVGSIHALLTTRYGWLLLAKLGAFGILVCLGVRNRFVIKTKLPRVSETSDLLAELRRNVIRETCLGLIVVTIVAWLGVTPPARGL